MFCFLPFLLTIATTGGLGADRPLTTILTNVLVCPGVLGGTNATDAFFNVPFAVIGCSDSILPVLVDIFVVDCMCG